MKSIHDKGSFGWLKVTILKWCEEEESEQCEEMGNFQEHISCELLG